MSKAHARDLVEKSKPGYLRELSLATDPGAEVDWAGLARSETWLILYLLTRDFSDAQKAFQNTKYQKVFLENVSAKAMLAHVSKWGTLFALPEPFGADLRRAALACCGDLPDQRVFREGIDEFELRLPEEAAMLPHILVSLMSVLLFQNPLLAGEGKRASPSEIGAIVRKYVPLREALHKVAQNPNHPKRVRAAAIIMASLHGEHEGESTQAPKEDNLIDFYEPAEGRWFLPAAALVLSEAMVAGRQDALNTMGALLEAANNDFYGRSAIDFAINGWREIARAPVKQSGVPQLWT